MNDKIARFNLIKSNMISTQCMPDVNDQNNIAN